MIRCVASAFVGLLASVWVPIFCYGCLAYLTGIQQQIDGTRIQNSFPYETFGTTLMKASAAYGFGVLLIIGYKVFQRGS